MIAQTTTTSHAHETAGDALSAAMVEIRCVANRLAYAHCDHAEEARLLHEAANIVETFLWPAPEPDPDADHFEPFPGEEQPLGQPEEPLQPGPGMPVPLPEEPFEPSPEEWGAYCDLLERAEYERAFGAGLLRPVAHS